MPLQCGRDVLKVEGVRLDHASTVRYSHSTVDGVRLGHASTAR